MLHQNRVKMSGERNENQLKNWIVNLIEKKIWGSDYSFRIKSGQLKKYDSNNGNVV